MPSKKPAITYRPDESTYSQIEARAKELGLGLSQLVDQLVKSALTDSAPLESETTNSTRPFYQDALGAVQVGEIIDRRSKDLYAAIQQIGYYRQDITKATSKGRPITKVFQWFPDLGLITEMTGKAHSGANKFRVVWKGECLTQIDDQFLDPETCLPFPQPTLEPSVIQTETARQPVDPVGAPDSVSQTSPIATETKLTREALKETYGLNESAYSLACSDVVRQGHWLAPDGQKLTKEGKGSKTVWTIAL